MSVVAGDWARGKGAGRCKVRYSYGEVLMADDGTVEVRLVPWTPIQVHT